MLLKRLVVLAVYLSLCTEMAYSLPKRRADDGAFKCLYKLLCHCGNKKKAILKECWDYLADETIAWMVNRTHECKKGGNAPLAGYEVLTAHLCSIPEDDYKDCYYEVSDAAQRYVKELYLDTRPEKNEEAYQIEQAKMCAGTHAMQCTQFGDC